MGAGTTVKVECGAGHSASLTDGQDITFNPSITTVCLAVVNGDADQCAFINVYTCCDDANDGFFLRGGNDAGVYKGSLTGEGINKIQGFGKCPRGGIQLPPVGK